MTIAFRIDPADTVATLLGDADAEVTVDGEPIQLTAPIALGHKVALAAIPAGAPVVKFGIPIGLATTAIARGDWVHLHNCASRYDERSGDFDLVTGTGSDMAYD